MITAERASTFVAALRGNWSRILTIGVVIVCASIEGYALSRNYGQPSNGGIRRYVVGEISDSLGAGQTFAVRASGLSSIRIYPHAVGDTPIGLATLELRDVTTPEAAVIVRRETSPLRKLAAEGEFTMRFPPQPSTGRRYELELRVWGAPPGHGIGLLATRGDGYRDGTLVVEGRVRRARDLVFDTSVDGATSNFAVLAKRLGEAGVPAASVMLLLVLVIKNAALLLIIRAAAAWLPAPAPAPSTR